MSEQTRSYRERRLAKAQRLREWAETRETKAEAASQTSHDAVAGIPLGQPIIVGHHSQRRHERAIERSDNAMSKAVENNRKASEFRSRAANIEAAAEQAIYSDDADALTRLQARIAELEAKRDAIKARNATFRKQHREELKGLSSYERDLALPHQGFELRNLSSNIGRLRRRLASLEQSR